jgi:hypothetical protein
MTDTANLSLPLIAAAQAQKHITHNEALERLDALVQLSVIDVLQQPPASPSEGARYICAAGALEEWAGHDDEIAAWQAGGWQFYAPRTGWIAWVEAQARLEVFEGSQWLPQASGGSSEVVSLLGINATADAANRLTVSAPNSLFNHEGSDHRVKINRAASADTASVLFQSDFSGRAEFGLTGDDNFRLKVSADGSNWLDAVNIDAATGHAELNLAQIPAAPQTIVNAPVSADIWLLPYGFWGRAIGNLNLSEPEMRYKLPVYVADSFDCSETKVIVSNAAAPGAVMRWGLRRWNRSAGWSGFGELLWETGPVAADTGGPKLIPISNVPVSAGWYVFEIAYSDNVGLEAVSYTTGLAAPLYGFTVSAAGFEPVNFVGNSDVTASNVIASGLPLDDTGLVAEPVQFNRGSVAIAMR